MESLLAEVERNLSISDSADTRRVWQLEKNEIFTVKSACALIDDIWHPASKNFGTLLWQSIFPPKTKMFLWLLLQGSLSIKGFLAYRKNICYDDACCSFCDMEIETINHLFIHCSIT
jgi:hypothetical protein